MPNFQVVGAGSLTISDDPDWACGGRVGFSIHSSWSAGGVIPRSEAKRLAEFILDALSKCTETEEEAYARINRQFTR